jgi:hypothetical protein
VISALLYAAGVLSVSTPYACPACHASFAAMVTGLDDPVASIAPRTQESLRKTRALLVQFGRAKEGDPVDELAAEILQDRARSELLYATCPRCGAKNPEGVAHRAREERRAKWAGIALVVALAAASWFVHWIALAMLSADVLVLRPMAIVLARRDGRPVRWLAVVGGVVAEVALIALVARVPHAAPLVILLPTVVQSLRRPEADDRRWREAAAKIAFAEGP